MEKVRRAIPMARETFTLYAMRAIARETEAMKKGTADEASHLLFSEWRKVFKKLF